MYICRHTSYRTDEILEKNIDWLNMMSRELSIIEFEKNMFELAVHGVEKETIDNLRKSFYEEQISDEKIKNGKAKQRLDINYFRMLGLSVGKPNKTVVKR